MAAGGAARATVHQEAMAEAQPVSFIFPGGTPKKYPCLEHGCASSQNGCLFW